MDLPLAEPLIIDEKSEEEVEEEKEVPENKETIVNKENDDHVPTFMINAKKCVLCHLFNKKHLPKFKCETCDKYLCNKPERNCFKEYHLAYDLWLMSNS